MLKGGQNILEMPCYSIRKTVPYFKELNLSEGSINNHLAKVTKQLSKQGINLDKRDAAVNGSDDIPDGAFLIYESNEKKLSYRLEVNDFKYYQYHRNNGVTKIGFISQNDNSTNNTNAGNATNVLTPVQGSMTLSDKINNAYLRSIFSDTQIVSGMQFMPFKSQIARQTDKAVNAFAQNVYPVLLSLAMPVFLYNIVMEREYKLLMYMKINGL